MSDSKITIEDARRILSEMDQKLEEHGVLVARAMLAVLADAFQRFRPSIDGALEAMQDFEIGLRDTGVHSLTWMRLMTELDHLQEDTEEKEK